MDNTSDPQPWRTDTIDDMVVEWDVGIRMDDGLVLRVRSLVNSSRTASR